MRAVVLCLLVAGCSAGAPGPAGPMGERGEKGEQGITGPATKIPTLVVASNRMVLGPSLGGNVALTPEGEINFAVAATLVYDGDNCTGRALLTPPTISRASIRHIAPDTSTLLKVAGAKDTIMSRSRRTDEGCAPDSGPVDGLPFQDTGIVATRYTAAELAIELR